MCSHKSFLGPTHSQGFAGYLAGSWDVPQEGDRLHIMDHGISTRASGMVRVRDIIRLGQGYCRARVF